MRKVAYALLVAAFFFAAAEIVLHAIDYQGDPVARDFRFQVLGELFGEPDPIRFWRLPGVEPKFHEGTKRIICLADSVTVMENGRGWPDRLPTNLLERGYQTPVEVFNAGVPGYTSYQGLLYLQHELLAHRPDLVAIQFGWNDHWQGPTGVADKDIRLPSPAVFRLQQGLAHSRLYRLLRTAMLPKPPANASPRVPLEDYRRNLREMVQLVQRQGGRVMLLTAPYLDNNEYWRDTHLAYIEATRQLAAETGATLVDLTPEFLHRPDLFLWPDSDKCHFGAAGAVIAAGMAAQAIIKHELLP